MRNNNSLECDGGVIVFVPPHARAPPEREAVALAGQK